MDEPLNRRTHNRRATDRFPATPGVRPDGVDRRQTAARRSASPVVLRLLGGFALDLAGRPCKPPHNKGRALLAYLAAEPGRAHTRSALAAMLWPNLDTDAALSNLRQVLHNLRRLLDSAATETTVLRIDRESVRLNATADLWVDAVEFANPSPVCPDQPDAAHCARCRAHLEELAALHQGAFLADFALPDCPDFDAWSEIQREALRLRALVRFAQLADCHERVADHARAADAAQRFLDLEPWNEEGLQRVMRLFALAGQPATALSAYDARSRAIERDRDRPLAAETHALAGRIRAGTLTGAAAPAAATMSNPPAPAAERRQLTVLHCEIAPAGMPEADAALTQMAAPQACCREILVGYGGHLVPLYGGNLLAYFGYPRADENASRHAVHAALAISRSVFAGVHIRVGIHTGLVISDGQRQAPDAIGAVSAAAIRLAQMTAPGEVVIGDATRHLVAGYFDCTPIGTVRTADALPGMAAFRIAADRGARHRLEAAAALAPLVGRRQETAALIELWQEARNGRRRVVLLSGDAGIGKSRLLLTLKDVLREQTCIVHELRCLPERRQSPFFPLTSLLGFLAGILPGDAPEDKFAKLAAFVEPRAGAAAAEAVPLLAGLLDLPVRTPYRPAAASPQRQREAAQSFVLDLLYGLARRQPLLLAVEDLQWIDPSTLEFLRLLVADARPAPILAVFSARPGFVSPWREEHVRTLHLAPLADAEAAALIAAVAPRLPADAVGPIVARADGVPLFAEELAKDAAAGEHAAVPATLHDLLAARLDRVGDAKRIAQLAAAIGREFPLDLLRAASKQDDRILLPALRRLQDAGLVGGGGRAGLQFRHALIRDTAYASQTLDDRRAAHRAIAEALTAVAGTEPELLAHHWTLAADYAQAAARWLEAGKLALHRSAVEEAAFHFRSGLERVPDLPAGIVSAHMELDLQLGLGAALSAAQGYASAGASAAYARAMTLADQHGGGPDSFPALWGMWASASSRAGYAHAARLAEQLLGKARLDGDPVHIQQSHFALGDTLYWQGRFAEAQSHLERCRELYRPADHGRHILGFGEDAGVTSGAYLSWVEWAVGHVDRATATSELAIAQARRLGHPFTLAYALTFAALLHCRLRQPEAALAAADETLALANSHGLPLWQIGATVARNWALAMQGRPESIATLRQCVAAIRTAMGGVTVIALTALADAGARLGRHEEALAAVAEAFALGHASGDRHAEAELHRIRGEALRGQGDADAASASFRLAIAVARRQDAATPELRAATGLARLAANARQRADARRRLETALSRCGEGTATPDRRDALAWLATAPTPAPG